MPVLDEQEYKRLLTDNVSAFIKAYEACGKAFSEGYQLLMPYTECDYSLPNVFDALQEVLNRWLKQHLKIISVEAQGDSEEEITLDDLDASLTRLEAIMGKERWKILDRLDDEKMTLSSFIDDFFTRYRFDLLSVRLTDLADALEGWGLERVAKAIANDLNLVKRKHRYGYEPKRTRRHYLFSRGLSSYYSSSYSWDLYRELSTLADNLAVVEKSTGATGLSEPVRSIAQELHNASKRFDSRTVLNEGSQVEAVMYNGHMVLRVGLQAVDPIFAFIRLNSDVEMFDFDEQIAA